MSKRFQREPPARGGIVGFFGFDTPFFKVRSCWTEKKRASVSRGRCALKVAMRHEAGGGGGGEGGSLNSGDNCCLNVLYCVI